MQLKVLRYLVSRYENGTLTSLIDSCGDRQVAVDEMVTVESVFPLDYRPGRPPKSKEFIRCLLKEIQRLNRRDKE